MILDNYARLQCKNIQHKAIFGSFFMFSTFYRLDLHNKFVLHWQIYDETYAKMD